MGKALYPTLNIFERNDMNIFDRAAAGAATLLLISAAWAGNYAISANGSEVTDSRTGLTWRRCAEGMRLQGAKCVGTPLGMSHAAALKHAEKNAAGGWRLPNSQELLSIADESRFKLAIDTEAFPNTPPDHFWTSDLYMTDYPYAVNFYNGFRYERYHTHPHFVRLVRGGK